jgi:hypothetical protein
MATLIILTIEAELFQPGLSATVDFRQYLSAHSLHSHICPMRNSNPSLKRNVITFQKYRKYRPQDGD